MFFNGEIGLVQSRDDSAITILFSSKDACDSCGLKIVCAPGKESERSLTMPNTGNFVEGQKVQMEELSNLELHLALIQYGLPILAFLLGLFLGYALPLRGILPPELVAFLVACIALGFSFFGARNLVFRLVDRIPEKYLRIAASD